MSRRRHSKWSRIEWPLLWICKLHFCWANNSTLHPKLHLSCYVPSSYLNQLPKSQSIFHIWYFFWPFRFTTLNKLLTKIKQDFLNKMHSLVHSFVYLDSTDFHTCTVHSLPLFTFYDFILKSDEFSNYKRRFSSVREQLCCIKGDKLRRPNFRLLRE